VTAPDPARTPQNAGLRVLRIALATIMAALIVAGVGAVTFMHAFGPRDGESIAHDRVDAAARALEHRLSAPHTATDAETLAATQFGDIGGSHIDAYAWRGTTSDADGARVDVAIRVDVGSQPSRELFQPGVAAGSAQECFRFHVRESRAWYRPIDCPDSIPPATPSASPTASASPAPATPTSTP